MLTEEDRERYLNQWKDLEVNNFEDKSITQFFTTGNHIEVFEEIVLYIQGREEVFKNINPEESKETRRKEANASQ